jgi:protein O-GlcNAc transferase
VTDAVRLLARAKRRYADGAIDEACALCRELLTIDAENAEALQILGVAAGRSGDTAGAIGLLERALASQPGNADLLANLGAVLRAAGRQDDAEARYREALAIAPEQAHARFNLANLLASRGASAAALREYALVLEHDPRHAGTLNNMALLLRAAGRISETELIYRRLIDMHPRDTAARSNLGALLMETGNVDAAIALYREAITADPANQQPYNNLGVALIETGAYGEAIARLTTARDIDPAVAEVHENLGNAYRKVGATAEAAHCYERALALRGGGGVRFKLATLLPVVEESAVELARWRARMSAAVNDLARDPPALRDPNTEVGVTTFNLSYHDTNNRDLQATLARAYLTACPSLAQAAPHCAAPPRRSRPRVGFISRHFANNAVGWCFHGVLRHMPRADMEVIALRFGESDDPLWQSIAADVDAAVVLPARLAAARSRIAELALDALVYTDIGMEPLTYFLAFARLAPLQCLLGGHPDTLGIPALDLYISSDLQEPPDAAAYYSERLVRLPGAPTYYDRPRLPSPLKPRSAFGLPDHVPLYFCAQTLIKIHPEMDALFAGILARDPDGLLLLPSGYTLPLVDRLRHRFARTLGPLADRVHFLPTMSHNDFMNVMALADVSLDTRPFGGGNTSWQAIAAGTPVVTWPGRFLRGRYTQALYRLADVTDTVVDSADAYVETAVRLARDAAFRADVTARVEAAAGRLFSDMTHVRALHDTILRALGR